MFFAKKEIISIYLCNFAGGITMSYKTFPFSHP